MINPDYVSGWGVDAAWCPYLTDVCGFPKDATCAVVDVHYIDHLNSQTASNLQFRGKGYNDVRAPLVSRRRHFYHARPIHPWTPPLPPTHASFPPPSVWRRRVGRLRCPPLPVRPPQPGQGMGGAPRGEGPPKGLMDSSSDTALHVLIRFAAFFATPRQTQGRVPLPDGWEPKKTKAAASAGKKEKSAGTGTSAK